MKADMILKSSRIFTALSGETISGGVAVRGNRIIAVGQEALAWRILIQRSETTAAG